MAGQSAGTGGNMLGVDQVKAGDILHAPDHFPEPDGSQWGVVTEVQASSTRAGYYDFHCRRENDAEGEPKVVSLKSNGVALVRRPPPAAPQA